MITFDKVHKSFEEKIVLNDISFDVKPGEFVTLFGPNGCGKSTLMNILSGVDKPTRGEIIGAKQLNGQIGFVFQDYRRTLLPWRNGIDNILLPLQLRGISKKEQLEKLDLLLSKLTPDIDLKQPIFTLSGGQAQMIGMMRALIIEPKLLILDEPFSALDYARTLELRQVVMNVAQLFNLTTLFISHDLDEALYLGDRVVFFTKKPTIVQDILTVPFPRNRTHDLLAHPDFADLKFKALKIFEKCAN